MYNNYLPQWFLYLTKLKKKSLWKILSTWQSIYNIVMYVAFCLHLSALLILFTFSCSLSLPSVHQTQHSNALCSRRWSDTYLSTIESRHVECLYIATPTYNVRDHWSEHTSHFSSLYTYIHVCLIVLVLLWQWPVSFIMSMFNFTCQIVWFNSLHVGTCE